MQFYHFLKTLSVISFSLLIGVIFYACGPEVGGDKTIEEIPTEGKISSIIRSPVTASGPTDTINVAKMEFEELIHDFGEVKEGEIVKHTFKFVNSGRIPLIINDAHSTCGCTIPDWPKKTRASWSYRKDTC